MLFLILALLFGSLFAVVFKICQIKRIDTAQVIFFNYVTAFGFKLIEVLSKGLIGQGDFPLSASTMAMVGVQGCFFYLGFLVMSNSTRRNGVALTTVAARSALVLPLVLSWLFLSQSAPSWGVVALMLVAMVLMILPSSGVKQASSEQGSKSANIWAMMALLSVFLCYGVSDFLLKLVQNSVEEPLLPLLQLLIFTTAMIVSFVACLLSGSFKTDGKYSGYSLRQGFAWKNLLGGLILGLVNTACTSFIMLALSRLSTSLFYPLYNVGIVCVATLVGVLFFKEKLKAMQIIGLLLASIAICLMLI